MPSPRPAACWKPPVLHLRLFLVIFRHLGSHEHVTLARDYSDHLRTALEEPTRCRSSICLPLPLTVCGCRSRAYASCINRRSHASGDTGNALVACLLYPVLIIAHRLGCNQHRCIILHRGDALELRTVSIVAL